MLEPSELLDISPTESECAIILALLKKPEYLYKQTADNKAKKSSLYELNDEGWLIRSQICRSGIKHAPASTDLNNKAKRLTDRFGIVETDKKPWEDAWNRRAKTDKRVWRLTPSKDTFIKIERLFRIHDAREKKSEALLPKLLDKKNVIDIYVKFVNELLERFHTRVFRPDTLEKQYTRLLKDLIRTERYMSETGVSFNRKKKLDELETKYGKKVDKAIKKLKNPETNRETVLSMVREAFDD